MRATVLEFKRREYRPDPQNGEVYACASFACHFDQGQEIQVPDGFIVVHMSHSSDSAGIRRGFKTLADAQAAAQSSAVEINAVYLP